MIEQLEIRNFRGLHRLSMGESTRLNLIAGRNNCGKTSLLEAIFLLSTGGQPAFVLNANVVRLGDPGLQSNVRSIRETFWKPLFSRLDTSQPIEVRAHHREVGQISLEVSLQAAETVELALSDAGTTEAGLHTEQMVLRYQQGDLTRESSCRLAPSGVELAQQDAAPPFQATIILSRNGQIQEDAVSLGALRTQKRGDLLLHALREVEPRLQSVEDSSASGFPMIWGDIGLDELVPLPAMGEGISRLARIVLAIARCPRGIVLVDEIENGFHHSILPKMWRVVSQAAEAFETQVFATTHSFECVQAADCELEDELALHRLEADGDGIRCVTYARDDISAAIKHGLEVR
ncbi:MAG: AAA family ATPase [Gammaproteobacteria bacterium]|nr:AAA family ATPase [Gammaproteobacteria bacterium]